MKVRFKQAWFAPGGVFYEKGVAEVDDSLKKLLPSSAEVLEDDYQPPKEKEQPNTLSKLKSDDLLPAPAKKA